MKNFLLHPHENQSKVLGYQGWDKILMIILVSSQKSPIPNISAPSVWIRFLLILLEKNNHIVWTLCLDSDHSASAKEMFYSDAVAFFFFLTFLEDCKPENKRLLTLSIMTFISIYSEAIFFFYGKIWNGKNYPFANMNIVQQFGNGFLLAFASEFK